MKNPVVVFLDPKCVPEAQGLTFPIGWTITGDKLCGLDAIKGNECCMIVVDDSQPLPNCEHTNKYKADRLLIILHNNSNLHKRCNVEQQMAQWGVCNVIGNFSHIDADSTFAEIRALIGNPGLIKGFLQRREDLALFDLLDQLAAICQNKIIQPQSDVEANWDTLTKSIRIRDQEFDRELRRVTKWSEKLTLVNKRATTLSY